MAIDNEVDGEVRVGNTAIAAVIHPAHEGEIVARGSSVATLMTRGGVDANVYGTSVFALVTDPPPKQRKGVGIDFYAKAFRAISTPLVGAVAPLNVINGDAEWAGKSNGSPLNSSEGWTTDQGNWAYSNYFPVASGTMYFTSGTSKYARTYQDIDIPPGLLEFVESGGCTAQLSYIIKNYSYAYGKVCLGAVDSDGNLLSRQTPIFDRQYGSWTNEEGSMKLPKGATKVRVFMWSIHRNDTLIDDISVTLNQTDNNEPLEIVELDVKYPFPSGDVSGWTTVIGDLWYHNWISTPSGLDFYYGKGAQDTSAYQEVDIPALYSPTESNGALCTLKWYQRNLLGGGSESEGGLGLTALDKDGIILQQFDAPKLNVGDAWSEQEVSYQLPIGTVKVRVNIEMYYISGSNCDCYMNLVRAFITRADP